MNLWRSIPIHNDITLSKIFQILKVYNIENINQVIITVSVWKSDGKVNTTSNTLKTACEHRRDNVNQYIFRFLSSDLFENVLK